MSVTELLLSFIVLPVLSISYALYLLVAYRGPTISDRVLAADVFFYSISLLFGVVSILIKSPIMSACTIVLVLWAYALDIYVAKYLERGELGD
ncbi:MAG: monovalent cation/H+ antiporter complex subunit F [Sulfolobales archaeon]|nr:monovalent cation/H+ antiporter complex subunit F [Sulfolobales archaeon]MDW8083341.1 monovalent cation/H+ antiporter complex subunit F [Sulfolobales archaeon]